MEIDLHGYHPAEIVFNGTLGKIVRQTWEMGESELTLIHGHGRNRGITPGFVNTNTGYFGLCIRRVLRHDKSLRQWIRHTTLDCRQMGCTSIRLKACQEKTGLPIDGEYECKGSPSFPGVVAAACEWRSIGPEQSRPFFNVALREFF